jgi:hypothetical protein
MTIRAVPFPEDETLTTDQRWARWIAKGIEQDRRTRKQLVAVAVAIACGFLAWLMMVGVRG